MPCLLTSCHWPLLLNHKLGHRPDPVSRWARPAKPQEPGSRREPADSGARPRRPPPGVRSRTGSEALPDTCLGCDSSPRGEERGLCGLPARAQDGRPLGSTAPRWPAPRPGARVERAGGGPAPNSQRPQAGVRPGKLGEDAPPPRGPAPGAASTKDGIVPPARGKGELRHPSPLLPGGLAHTEASGSLSLAGKRECPFRGKPGFCSCSPQSPDHVPAAF